MSKKKPAVDLDSILDDALDEFEEQQLVEKAAAADKSKKDGAASKKEQSAAERSKRAAELQALMRGVEDPEFGKTVQKTLTDLSYVEGSNATVEDLFSEIRDKFGDNRRPGFIPDDRDGVEGINAADFNVSNTLKMLGEAQRGMAGIDASKMEEAGEGMMEDMMAQFEALGEKEDYNEVVDGVMRQLLSKDLMFEPTRQICDKFPEWLALHKKNLSDAEYENYGRQYQSFQKILAVYITEPDNFPRLMELMFDMQQYGQPPAEIIQDLAPGLRFDENGMPIMPNMGAGMFPGQGEGPQQNPLGMPGGDGKMPDMANLPAMMANGSCSIC
jgi:peroxin-19